MSSSSASASASASEATGPPSDASDSDHEQTVKRRAKKKKRLTGESDEQLAAKASEEVKQMREAATKLIAAKVHLSGGGSGWGGHADSVWHLLKQLTDSSDIEAIRTTGGGEFVDPRSNRPLRVVRPATEHIGQCPRLEALIVKVNEHIPQVDHERVRMAGLTEPPDIEKTLRDSEFADLPEWSYHHLQCMLAQSGKWRITERFLHDDIRRDAVEKKSLLGSIRDFPACIHDKECRALKQVVGKWPAAARQKPFMAFQQPDEYLAFLRGQIKNEGQFEGRPCVYCLMYWISKKALAVRQNTPGLRGDSIALDIPFRVTPGKVGGIVSDYTFQPSDSGSSGGTSAVSSSSVAASGGGGGGGTGGSSGMEYTGLHVPFPRLSTDVLKAACDTEAWIETVTDSGGGGGGGANAPVAVLDDVHRGRWYFDARAYACKPRGYTLEQMEVADRRTLALRRSDLVKSTESLARATAAAQQELKTTGGGAAANKVTHSVATRKQNVASLRSELIERTIANANQSKLAAAAAAAASGGGGGGGGGAAAAAATTEHSAISELNF
jgi:hypothetical protein